MPRKLTPEQKAFRAHEKWVEKTLRHDAKKDPEGVYLRLLRRMLVEWIEGGARDCGVDPEKYANDMEGDSAWWQTVYESARHNMARHWTEMYKLPQLSDEMSMHLIDRVFSGEMRSWKNGVTL